MNSQAPPTLWAGEWRVTRNPLAFFWGVAGAVETKEKRCWERNAMKLRIARCSKIAYRTSIVWDLLILKKKMLAISLIFKFTCLLYYTWGVQGGWTVWLCCACICWMQWQLCPSAFQKYDRIPQIINLKRKKELFLPTVSEHSVHGCLTLLLLGLW